MRVLAHQIVAQLAPKLRNWARSACNKWRYAGEVNFPALLLPDFSLIVCGYVLCRFTPLNRSVWGPIENLVYYFLFPILLFQNIVNNPLQWASAGSMALAGVLLIGVGVALSYSARHWPWVRQGTSDRLHAGSAQVAFRFNSFVALALAPKVAGAEGAALIAVLVGVCVPLLNVAAVYPMSRQGQGKLLPQLVRNPLILGTLSGLVASVLGFRMPEWLLPMTSRLGQAGLTLGLMTAGAGMQLGTMMQSKRLAGAMLSIKHLAMPLAAVGIAWGLGLEAAPATVLLMFAALPTASSCYVLAARMGFDGPYVAGLVTLSTLLGMASLSLALGPLRLLLSHG